MNGQQIYVELLDEGTLVWRPVSATRIKGMIFRIEGVVPKDETWAFQPGEIVECHEKELISGSSKRENRLVAFRLVSSSQLNK